MILLDTSALIDALSGRKKPAATLRRAIRTGQRVAVPALVLYEWLRGPRTTEELTAQEALFPGHQAVPFGSEEAAIAAQLHAGVRRPRGREIDLAIAACALTWDATLWTLNLSDFNDIPGLTVSRPG